MAKVKGRAFKPLYLQQLREPGGWVVGLTLVVAMLFWHWKLLLATSIGALVMLLVYRMQEWDWQRYWSSLSQFLRGYNQPLTRAVGSGAMATLSTYMIISIWVDSDSPWIAASTIVQILGNLTILTLVVWQTLNRPASQNVVNLDQMLSGLTDANPVKRLVAVQQLTQWGTDPFLHPSERCVVADCFRLMLTHEQEAVIRGAVLDGLQVLDNNRMLGKGTQPLQVPMVLKQSADKLHR
ncbi:hypothetical protein NDI39_13785 [Microcoleus sp. ZQ-A2]|nr:hypothetical protein [Microcoleus sp. FACHB-1]